MSEYLKVRTAPRDRNLLLRTDAIVAVERLSEVETVIHLDQRMVKDLVPVLSTDINGTHVVVLDPFHSIEKRLEIVEDLEAGLRAFIRAAEGMDEDE